LSLFLSLKEVFVAAPAGSDPSSSEPFLLEGG